MFPLYVAPPAQHLHVHNVPVQNVPVQHVPVQHVPVHHVLCIMCLCGLLAEPCPLIWIIMPLLNCCRTQQYSMGFISISVHNSVFDGVGLQEQTNNFFVLASADLHKLSSAVLSTLLSLYGLVLWGWGIRTDMVSITHSALLFRPLLMLIIKIVFILLL